MTNLDSIFKSRDITFANKGPSSQGYGFSGKQQLELDMEQQTGSK